MHGEVDALSIYSIFHPWFLSLNLLQDLSFFSLNLKAIHPNILKILFYTYYTCILSTISKQTFLWHFLADCKFLHIFEKFMKRNTYKKYKISIIIQSVVIFDIYSKFLSRSRFVNCMHKNLKKYIKICRLRQSILTF